MGGTDVIEALLQAERLLMYGMADQAERIYTSTLEQDPLNAIAVVGLARVALERGDDQLAYRHARRALEIDPQNAAALRLEQRLRDVFEVRAASHHAATPPPPPGPTAPTQPEIRPSEQIAFTRNPSMAEHQQMEQVREQPLSATPAAPEAAQATEQPRRGLFRRLLGE